MGAKLNALITLKPMGSMNVGRSLTFCMSCFTFHAGIFDCSGRRIIDNVSYIICLVLHPG